MALNMRHQAQMGFRGIFVETPQHQKGYPVYVSHTWKIIYLYDVVFDERFSIGLEYTSRPYAEAMAMRLAVSYIPYDTSSGGKTGDIITFTQFEEGGLISETHYLLSETRDNAEISNKYDYDSIMPPLISEE